MGIGVCCTVSLDLALRLLSSRAKDSRRRGHKGADVAYRDVLAAEQHTGTQLFLAQGNSGSFHISIVSCRHELALSSTNRNMPSYLLGGTLSDKVNQPEL